MERVLPKSLFGFMANQTTQNKCDTVAKLPNDPPNANSVRTCTHQSLKWMMLVICLLCINFQVKALEPIKSIEGFWKLTVLEGNDTLQKLNSEEIAKSTKNFLHDFPLYTTTLSFSGSNFTMTHHVGGVMSGTFDIKGKVLTLHVSSCEACGAKDFIFIIRNMTNTKLVIDTFEEDEGSASYCRLTFERKAIVNNVNQGK